MSLTRNLRRAYGALLTVCLVAALPISVAEAQTSGDTTYYLHSLSGDNTVDQTLTDGATFDTTAPTFGPDEYSTARDLPGFQNAGAIEVVDPTWRGSLESPARSVTVDFFGEQLIDQATGGANYTVRVLPAGATAYVELLPPIARENVPAGIVNIKHTFTSMRATATAPEVPLELPAGPLTFTIRGTFVDTDASTELFYDSTNYPASFTVSGTGGPGPTASPTPTEEPTEPPPPPPPSGDCRSSYPVVPNDPYFGGVDPADFTPQQWGPRVINAPQAWQEGSATGCGIRVAVLDSGLDIREGSSGVHPDFACSSDKVLVMPGSDRVTGDSDPDDENGHGTHVAGIIGACTDNGTGTIGVAPDSTIVPIRVLDAAGSGNDDQLITGINKAVDAGAHVINMSLSYSTGKEIINDVAPIDAALERARAAGVVVVAAAGNDSLPLCNYPALAEDVLCVGATDPRDLRTWYSSGLNKPYEPGAFDRTIVAPGGTETIAFCDVYQENVLSTYSREQDTVPCSIDDGYQTVNGTSMAAPHVAGVAALVYERVGGTASAENAQQVIAALTSSAVDLGPPGPDPVFGSGRVDALAAVRSIESTTPTAENTAVGFTSSSAQAGYFGDEATFSAQLLDEQGLPVSGADLTFELVGAGGSAQWSAVTDLTGVATTTRVLTDLPGDYQLFVRYAGAEGTYEPSSNTMSFAVLREVTEQTLTVDGNGSKRTITATLTEDDGPAIGGVTISFFANGTAIGEAVTNDAGTVSISAPPGWRGNEITFESRFTPTNRYEGSSAQQAV